MKARFIGENIEFKRGQDPKEALSLGMINKITSDDFMNFIAVTGEWDFSKKMPTEKQIINLFEEEEWELEEGDLGKLMYLLSEFRKGNIEEGESFDWKEEDEMEDYMQEESNGRFIYNGNPGSDTPLVIFSKIYFPNAEEL